MHEDKFPSVTDESVLNPDAPQSGSPSRRLGRKTSLDLARRFLLMSADGTSVLLSFLLGLKTYHLLGFSKDTRGLDFYLGIGLSAVVLVLIIYEIKGLYQPQSSVLNIHEHRGVSLGVLYSTILFLALSFYFRDDQGNELSRLITTLSFVWLFIVANLVRLILDKVQESFYRRGITGHRVLIHGSGELGKKLLRRLSGSPQLGYFPVGIIDDDPERHGIELQGHKAREYTKIKVVGRIEDLPRLVRELNAEEIFVADTSIPESSLGQIIRTCSKLGITYRFVPNLYGHLFQDLQIETLDGLPLLRRRAFEERPLYQTAKRVFDIGFSLLAMIITSPVFLVVYYLIRRSSSGTVFFTQKRIGQDGKAFTIYKFRTMYEDTPQYEFHPKSRDDHRLTPLGRWLRRLSLDELPQFVNVLRGDMSVVGPRPEMPFIVDGYDELQRTRLKVKPGVTGLWQISADRSSMIHENMDYDVFYVHNRSLLLDLIIVLETCFLVILGVGAV